ncbi:hypothetical protein EVAR_92637_1 [Eumeta japonica]|uniref:Uncharacterized protein n=1 Tax=Eumeta variegata TaxID=151549 RepID=A0A4C1SWR0_EUMVA|nr:hypothetical protein EVAR_92637_1 [Eumeta japonica]
MKRSLCVQVPTSLDELRGGDRTAALSVVCIDEYEYIESSVYSERRHERTSISDGEGSMEKNSENGKGSEPSELSLVERNAAEAAISCPYSMRVWLLHRSGGPHPTAELATARLYLIKNEPDIHSRVNALCSPELPLCAADERRFVGGQFGRAAPEERSRGGDSRTVRSRR